MAQTFKPPATQRIYDVCILGSHLGGAVAGALLARRGFRVLQVSLDDPGPGYLESGYLLPWGPSLVPAPQHLPSAEVVLVELGLATDLGRALVPCDPDLQVLLPRHRVDVTREPSRLARELRREWPGDADRLGAAFAELSALFDRAGVFLRSAPPLPPSGLGERFALRKALSAAARAPGEPAEPVPTTPPFRGLEDHELVRCLWAAHRLLGFLDGPPSPLSLVRLLGAAARGTHHLAGGPGALRDMVRRRIAESRGEVHGGPGEPGATSLVIEGSRLAAVRLAGSPDAYVARAFVLAADGASLRRLLPADAARSRFASLLGKVRPRRKLLTLNLVVKRPALPPALGPTAVVQRDPAGQDPENVLFLHVEPARRQVPRGSVETVADELVVCASTFVPAQALGPEALAAAAAGLRAAAADAIPFFERHLVAESLPARHAGEQASPHHPLYETEIDPALGLSALPVRAPFKNAFFAGREVLPGLGVEGEFYAGIQAAGHVAAMLGRKEVLK
ncbi:MAG TPA: phytoene dehydrogenase [Anaeromyxobacteraceae bacterium]|nr:phytoene dehydrogenase [Anaeromyxobacteraceae bacterium]